MEKKCPQCGALLPTGGLAGLCPACLLAQAANETAVPPGTAGFVPPTVAELAALFPQLEIRSFIGRGGMGAVYQARQPGLDRLVALKILPARADNGAAFAERFNREARALAKLNHPNIVTVYDFGQIHGMPYFVMEYVDGLNLRQLELAAKLSPREALQIVPQICEALQFAHDAGIVHRDIKPDNILLDKKGRVKIADFGIAKIMGAPQETGIPETQGAIGTPNYMAPEQIEKPQTVDHRADIFSLGVVFYEMLTGELPLGKFAPPSSGPRGIRVDVRLDDVVLRALEKEPERRYQHASQVKTAVETIAGTPPGGGGGFGGTPPSPAAPAPSPDDFLGRDYRLDIGACVNRGWSLMKAHFWELLGIHALMTFLIFIADSVFARLSTVENNVSGVVADGTSIVGLVLTGPLLAGMYLYFLKTMRGEATTVETAFAGFSKRFLHLFLANLIAWLLIGLGFVCFILPGIYLMVVWCFTLVLVIDKGFDFWPAMELSRKMVHKHWWQVFGLLVVAAIVGLAGLVACCIGVLASMPVAIATFLYAYEDIFGGEKPAPPGSGQLRGAPPIVGSRSPAPAAQKPGTTPLDASAPAKPAGPTGPIGPGGTIVMPGAPPPRPPSTKAGGGRFLLMAGLVIAVLLAVVLLVAGLFRIPQVHPGGWALMVLVPFLTLLFFFLIIATVVTFIIGLATNNWRFLKYVLAVLAAVFLVGIIAVPVLIFGSIHSWSPRTFKVFAGSPTFPAIPNLPTMPVLPRMPAFPNLPGQPQANPGVDYDNLVSRLREELGKVSVDFDQPRLSSSGEHDLTISFISLREKGLWDGTNETWKTITGTLNGKNEHGSIWEFAGGDGMPDIQFAIDDLNPAQVLAGAALRLPSTVTVSAGNSHEAMAERLEAAENIMEIPVRDKALRALAGEAAQAGDVEIVKSALGNMMEVGQVGAATRDYALLLAKAGHRKEAIEMAEGISDISIRDQTLSELAQ